MSYKFIQITQKTRLRVALVVSSHAVRQARHSENAWARQHVERVVTWRAMWNSGLTNQPHLQWPILALVKHKRWFARCNDCAYETCAGQLKSMGYGFVEYKLPTAAKDALKLLQHTMLDGHQLELKMSNRATLCVFFSSDSAGSDRGFFRGGGGWLWEPV